jgi:hypothetical protein
MQRFRRCLSVNLFALLVSLFAIATVPWLGATVYAAIYDEFETTGIDASKWTTSDPSRLFSQPGDGNLYFYSDNTSGVTPLPRAGLTSTISFGPGFFTMDFNGFSSTNISPANQGLGSFAAIGLGTKDTTYVRMLRGRVVSDDWGYFEANYFDGTDLHVWYVTTHATSGQLGLSYDGPLISFLYNNGSDGWQTLDTSGPDTNGHTATVAPSWSSAPPFFISGTPGGSGTTSFAVQRVEFSAIPEPSTWILLGSGLVALAGLARKKLTK